MSAHSSCMLQPELNQIHRHASALRNGIKNTIEPGGQRGWGYVPKMRFSDGVTLCKKYDPWVTRRFTHVVVVAKLISKKNVKQGGKRLRIPSVASWVSERFVERWELLTSAPSRPPYSGFDRMLLLAWILEQFTGEEIHQLFVLHYWDLRVENILVDNDHNIAGYHSCKS